MKAAKQELFLGPVLCASIYSALSNNPSALTIFKEVDPIKKITTALTLLLGAKPGKKYGISYISSGRGKGEVTQHAAQITQLLQGKFDFDVDHSVNRDHFYLESGLPRGYYVEGLSTEDEKTLNNVFLKQFLIVSPSEMIALGFDESQPRSAIAALKKIASKARLEDRIVLIGKNGSACVIAESDILQLLQKGMPQPIPMSPAKAIAILYHADAKYEKIDVNSLQENVDDLKQLSKAFKKISINCSVNLENSKNLYVVALPEEGLKIEEIWKKNLVELDINMCQYLNVEIENTADSITAQSVAFFLDNNNFQFLSGPAVITKDLSNLQKLAALKSEWLEIENDYLKLLSLQPTDSLTVPQQVVSKLVEQKIIPANLPVEARESMGNVLKISIPGKYKNRISEHCTDFISEHSLEVTPLVTDSLYQQTGIKEIKSALNALQQQQRLGGGFTTIKSGKTYIVLGDKNDIGKIKNWVRYPVSVNPVYKKAIKLEAMFKGVASSNFKASCDSLKINCEQTYSLLLNRDDVATDIKTDPENLQKLNDVVANYVTIGKDVYRFILKSLTMHDWENLCVQINPGDYLISKNLLTLLYKESVPRLLYQQT